MADPTIETVGGRETIFGPSKPAQKFGAVVAQNGPITMVEYRFTYDDLPKADEDNAMVFAIPEDSLIVSARLFADVAWASGTSLSIGTEQQDGTDIDVDGLFTTTELSQANLSADTWHVGSAGALLGATSHATADSVIVVIEDGTFTTGEAILWVEYMASRADVA